MFERGSAMRRVSAEGVILLGGGRALLMQLAHPLVARGVAEHSSFDRDRIGRLLRTLRPTYAMVFGTPQQARAAAAGVHRLHERVTGDGYRALDPELLLWVYATLVDTALLMHDRFVEPLDTATADGYYRDSAALAAMWGVPAEALPPDLAAFRAYLERMLTTIEVTDEARRLAAQLFALDSPLAPALWLSKELTAGLLPPRLRRAYGLAWDPPRAAALSAAERGSRGLLPLLPPALRSPPSFILPSRTTAAVAAAAQYEVADDRSSRSR
jgi:uncharacterized protein (DUF2236 family)